MGLARDPKALAAFTARCLPADLRHFLFSAEGQFEASCSGKFDALLKENKGGVPVSAGQKERGLTLDAMQPVLQNLAEGNPKVRYSKDTRQREPPKVSQELRLRAIAIAEVCVCVA